jgi:hypothetical protein
MAQITGNFSAPVVQDERPVLEQMRRSDLRLLAASRGVAFNDDMIKDQLVALLAPVYNGMTGAQIAAAFANQQAAAQTVPAAPQKSLADFSAEAQADADAFKEMGVFALRAAAIKAGFEVTKQNTKPEILTIMGIE